MDYTHRGASAASLDTTDLRSKRTLKGKKSLLLPPLMRGGWKVGREDSYHVALTLRYVCVAFPTVWKRLPHQKKESAQFQAKVSSLSAVSVTERSPISKDEEYF